MISGKTLYFVNPKSTLHRKWPSRLTFEPRHDLGKYLLFCPSKIYSALYQGWGQVQLTKYSSTPSTPNIYQVQVKYSFF